MNIGSLPLDLKEHVTLVLVSKEVIADRVINGKCLADFNEVFFDEKYSPLRSYVRDYFTQYGQYGQYGSSAKVVVVKSKREQPKVIVC